MDGSGGFTDGLSDIAVSAFNVAVVRFCGSFCPLLMLPMSGFEKRSFCAPRARTVYGRFIGWFIGRFVGNGFPA